LLRRITVQFVLARHAVHMEGSSRRRNFLTDYFTWHLAQFPSDSKAGPPEYGNRRRTYWQPRQSCVTLL
jgi:hypothetical protein